MLHAAKLQVIFETRNIAGQKLCQLAKKAQKIMH